MASAFDTFNTTVNSALTPVFANPYLSGFIKLALVMFGSLAAPKISPKYGYLFANTYFRIFIMVMIIWVFNQDPALAIMTAVTYFITMHWLVKNAVGEVAATGTLSDDIATLLNGGSGLGLKSLGSTMETEKKAMQNAVEAAQSAGFMAGVPQAVSSTSGPINTTSVASIATEPSGVPATDNTMFVEGDGQIRPFIPDGVEGLAPAPK